MLPVDTGGKIRSYNILKHVVRSHEVKLLSYYGGKRDLVYEKDIQKEFPGARTIFTAAPEGTPFEQFRYLRALLRAAPFAVAKFTHPAVKREIARLIDLWNVDVAVCDFLSASQNFPTRSSLPTVLFQHNVETALWTRIAATERNPIKALAYKIEAAKMIFLERNAIGNFHHIVAVSEHDRTQMLDMYPGCSISVVPTGVDTQKFSIAPPSSSDPPRIVFTGSMDWEPNIDAVQYFCDQIFPTVRANFPKAIFQIVGRQPHAKVRRLASDSVQVTGTVSSVTEYLRDATAVIVPVRIGGGTRLKIFEAMAMGKAVVSTNIGAEGLDVRNGRDLILADTASAFADAILLLLSNDELRLTYEQAASRLACQYDWSKIALQFCAVLQDAVQHGSKPQKAQL
ncbi:MAG TPA: glycosyltransferase family 4 protein [Candidatus Sulfotelmatobacter sp.]